MTSAKRKSNGKRKASRSNTPVSTAIKQKTSQPEAPADVELIEDDDLRDAVGDGESQISEIARDLPELPTAKMGSRDDTQISKPAAPSSDDTEPPPKPPDLVDLTIDTEEARDRVLMGVIKVLIFIGNKPTSLQQLVDFISTHKLISRPQGPPTSEEPINMIVQSSIAAHIQRRKQSRRKPIIKQRPVFQPNTTTVIPGRWLYYLDAPGVPIGPIVSNDEHEAPAEIDRHTETVVVEATATELITESDLQNEEQPSPPSLPSPPVTRSHKSRKGAAANHAVNPTISARITRRSASRSATTSPSHTPSISPQKLKRKREVSPLPTQEENVPHERRKSARLRRM